MDALLQDLRFALRVCARTPGFTAIAVLALALGIGANTAIFTLVNSVLLERLPFRNPERIVTLWETSPRRPDRNNVLGPAQFVRWRERATAFERMALLADLRQNLTGSDYPEEVIVQAVTGDFFPVVGVAPLLGRTFSDEENRDPNSNAVILGYELWQRRFSGDQGILGRKIELNARPRTVVGVMPPGFRVFLKEGSIAGKPSDLWVPYVLPADARNFGGRYAESVALLRPGMSIRDAQTQLTAIARALEKETPQRNTGWGARVVGVRDQLSSEYRGALLILAGAVAFVLLIACANVANLLLARGAARQREIAIRTALGAGRGRIVRQLLTESLVLAAGGGATGLLLAIWGLKTLLALSPIDFSDTAAIHISYPVLIFTAVVSVLTAIVCGLAPAFAGSRVDVHDAINEGTRQVGGSVRHVRMRHAFVISEMALAIVLLVGAGLMLRSLSSLRRVNPGYSTSDILTMRLQLPGAKYQTDETRVRFYREAMDRIRQLPGVHRAGAVSYLPLTGLGARTGFTIEGQPPPPPGHDNTTDAFVCDNDYLRVLNVPLISGRLFTEHEMREKSNVVLISESLARTYFPTENPIGKRLSIVMTDPVVPTEVIGVVGDIKFTDFMTAPRPTTYWPHPQLAYGTMTLAIRTSPDPLTLAPVVERTIRTLDRDQPMSDVRTMSQWVARSLGQARFSSMLLALFASVALMLAAIGIYGVMSYAVGQRTAEIGIRLALGAEAGTILKMVVAGAMRLATIGLGVGAVLALVLSQVMTALLYETKGYDPATFAGALLVLGATAFVASYLPARRASRIAPVEALRQQ